MTIIIPIATLCVGLVVGFFYCDRLARPVITGWRELYYDAKNCNEQLIKEYRNLSKRRSDEDSGESWKQE